MDEIRKLTKEERRRAYDEVFREAFPRAELKPLHAMERMIAAGEYEFLGMIRDGEPVGFVCNWLDGRYVLIDYLCVPRSIRCGGIGAALLRLMMAQYPADTVFIGETEAETGDPDRDGLILRRQGFYLRTGAQFMPYDSALFGVHYRTIVWAKEPADPDEVQRRHDGFYRRAFPKLLYAAAVQLPLKPGEKPFPVKDWDERPDEEGEEQ